MSVVVSCTSYVDVKTSSQNKTPLDDNGALDFKIRGTLASGKANVTMTCSDYYKSHVYGVAFKKGKVPLVHVNNSTGPAWLDPHYMKRVKTEVHSLHSGNVKVSLTLSKITCSDEGHYECEIQRIPSSKSIQKYFRILSKPGPLKMENINNTVPHTDVLLEIRCGGMVGNPPGNITWYRQRRQDSGWIRLCGENINQTEPRLNRTSCQYHRSSTLHYILTKVDIDLVIKCSVNNGVDGNTVEVTGEFGVDELGVEEIAGITAGCLLAALILLGFCCWCQRRKQYSEDDSDDEDEKQRMEPDSEISMSKMPKPNDDKYSMYMNTRAASNQSRFGTSQYPGVASIQLGKSIMGGSQTIG
ncbi:XP_014788429.1PREDICTED: uncharacterized protein LOC106882031 [Octopus vulgaris]|uniref:XP_014788429.1PREDICTED: uncharacterized protein LOC106882031 n=1 Tax=Octopus vulgaris TaxID=6645 RepID=A0AA36FGN6_OCTVU|nr:XP_014788429.1PREDICTED: uncharacterized protein LOC106882031 [Octopus vulgaris]